MNKAYLIKRSNEVKTCPLCNKTKPLESFTHSGKTENLYCGVCRLTGTKSDAENMSKENREIKRKNERRFDLHGENK